MSGRKASLAAHGTVQLKRHDYSDFNGDPKPLTRVLSFQEIPYLAFNFPVMLPGSAALSLSDIPALEYPRQGISNSTASRGS